MRGWALLLPVLAGCPYLFEPPDLSNVDRGRDDTAAPETDADADTDSDADSDADADTDSDSDADTDTGTGTGGTGDTGEPIVLPPYEPLVVSFEVVPRLEEKVFHFDVRDAEGNLDGGQITLTNGVDTYVLAIPADVDDWRTPGTSTHTVPMGAGWLDCATDLDEDWTITVTDAAGNASATVPFHLHVEGLGALPEVGNQWSVDNHVIPDPPPWTACVVFDTEPLFRDLEAIVATLPAARSYVAQVDPAPTNDVDLWVYYWPIVDNDGDGYADELALSTTVGDASESASWTGAAAQEVLIQAVWWRFQPSDYPPYQATVLFAPE